MRNLKKVLSLTLALVMLLGMMVVGAGAAEYTDAGEIEYKEAADVLTAIGVMQGRDDGSFDPKAELDRAEGAAIIYRMLTGGMTANPSGGATGFVDVDGVANYAWASGIIADLANKGIIAGEDATHFNPSGKLTGAAFGKMLLVALGYNADTQGYVGGGWDGNVIRDAYSSGISVTGVIMSNNITREQAAQMSLNTLQATMVYQKGGIQVGDVVIPGDKAEKIPNDAKNDYAGRKIGDDKDEYMQFCETYFPSLTLVAGTETDDFGRNTNVWKVGKDTVATAESNSATVAYTTKTGATQVDKDLKGLDYADGLKATENGTAGTAITGASDIAGLTAPGKLVEVYTEDDVITKVVAVTYSVGTVNSITEKNGKTTYNVGGVVKYNDEDNTNVILAGAVEKDDVVTYAVANSKLYVYPTTSFDGNQTAKKTSSNGVVTITVGGDSFTLATGVTSFVGAASFTNSDKDATYFVDVNGFVVLVKAAAATPDQYAMIVRAIAKDATNLDSPTGYTVSVRAVLADGTIADYELATKLAEAGKSLYTTGGVADTTTAGDIICGDVVLAEDGSESTILTSIGTGLAGTNGKLWGYTIDPDTEKMTLKTVLAAPTNDTTMAASKVYQADITGFSTGDTSKDVVIGGTYPKTVLFNNKTVFVLYKETNGKWAAETAVTGVANVSVSSASGVAVLNKTAKTSPSNTNAAAVVFLNAQSVAATVDYVFVNPASEVEVLRDGKSVNQYKGTTADGDEIDVWTADGITKVGLYQYDADNKLNSTALVHAETALATTVDTSHIYNRLGAAETNGDLVKVGTGWYALADDAATVLTDDDLTGISGNKCFVVMDAKAEKIAAVFVYTDGTANLPTATPDAADINKLLNDAAEGGTVTLPNNTTLPTTGTVTVPEGKTLVLPSTTTTTNATVVVPAGATLKVEGNDLPTITGAGKVEVKGTVATGLDKVSKPAEKTGTKDTLVAAPATDGVELSGSGKLNDWSATKTLNELAAYTGSTTCKVMNFKVAVTAKENTIKTTYTTAAVAADADKTALEALTWVDPKADSGTGSTAGYTHDYTSDGVNEETISFYVGDKVTAIKISVTTTDGTNNFYFRIAR